MPSRFISRDSVLVIYDDDLPNMATHTRQRDCGYSIYKGVFVQWDEDHDTRVLDFLDTLDASMLENLAVVQEHEGCIAFLWKGKIPTQFEEHSSVNADGDNWSIIQSQRLQQ